MIVLVANERIVEKIMNVKLITLHFTGSRPLDPLKSIIYGEFH